MEDIIFTIHDRPGLWYSPAKTAELVDELRRFANLSLNPLPNYQIFSNADDKVVITAYTQNVNGEGQQLLAFTSAVMIAIPQLPEAEREVLHTGLTVIAPELRRKGMFVQLFMRLILYVYSTRPPKLPALDHQSGRSPQFPSAYRNFLLRRLPLAFKTAPRRDRLADRERLIESTGTKGLSRPLQCSTKRGLCSRGVVQG